MKKRNKEINKEINQSANKSKKASDFGCKNDAQQIDLHAMSKKEKKEYFNRYSEKDGQPDYYYDILDQNIHIAEVPFKYRTRTAYIYAVRVVRDGPRYGMSWMAEKKVIENLLISDIMKAHRKHRSDVVESLSNIYWSYFESSGMWKE